jgi:ABC-type xylose transport system substrate-binding protein
MYYRRMLAASKVLAANGFTCRVEHIDAVVSTQDALRQRGQVQTLQADGRVNSKQQM